MSGLVWSFSGQGFQIGIQFVTLATLARLISPADFGTVAAAMIIIGFSEVFSQIGTGAALVKMSGLRQEHIRAGFSMAACMGLIFAVIVAISAPLVAGFFRIPGLETVLQALAAVFVLNGFSIVAEALLQRNMRFKVIATSNIVSYVAGFGLAGISTAMLGFGVWALVTANIVQALCKAVFLNYMVPHAKKPTWNYSHYADLLYYGGGFAAARLGNYFAVQGDNFVVGRMLGVDALGFYSRAYQLMLLPIKVFGNVLDTVLFPVMAEVQNDRAKLATIYQQGVALVAILTLPASILLFLIAPELILIVLGPQWHPAVAPFQVLAVAMLCRTSYRMSDSLAKATGAVYRRAWRQWVYAACVLGGAYFGSRLGIAGVAVAIVGATVINFILMAWLSLAQLQLSWRRFVWIHMPAILGGLTVLVEGTWLCDVMRDTDANPLLLVTIVSGAVALTLGSLMLLFPKIMLGQYGRDTFGRVIQHFRT